MRSKAQMRADKKYIAKTYKRFATNARLEFVPQIEEYKSKQGTTSDSGIFYAAIKYCIENDIDLTNYYVNLNIKKNKSE